MATNITLKAYEDGVEKLSVTVNEGDPKYLISGYQQVLGFRILAGAASDWAFDNWSNGDNSVDIFTDPFTGAIVANLGVGWTQNAIAGLTTHFRINTNVMKPADKSVVLGLPLELATPATGTDITDQHCQITYTQRDVNTTNPIGLMLRGNQVTLTGYQGYIMQRRSVAGGIYDVSGVGDGPFLEQYEYIIGHYDYDTNTITTLATSGTLHGVDLDSGISAVTMKFTAVNISTAPPVADVEEHRTKLYACVRDKKASWASWKFSGTLRGMSVMDNLIVLSIERGDLIFVETIDISPVPGTRFLDCEILSADMATPVLASGITTWTLPFDIPDDPDHPLAIVNVSTGEPIVYNARSYNDKIDATGDFVATSVAIGLLYPTQWELSPIFLTESEPDGETVALTDGRLQIRHIEFNYANTGEFTVTVIPNTDDDTQSYEYTFDGSSDSEKGTFRVPVFGQNSKARITVGGTSHRPFAISNFSWTGYVSQITKRV